MRKKGLKCACGGTATPKRKMHFNSYLIDGWKCSRCGEVYYDSDQAQKILILNKLKKQKFHLKLNKVRSNLILRIPKEVSDVLELEDGSEVEFSLKDDDKILIST